MVINISCTHAPIEASKLSTIVLQNLCRRRMQHQNVHTPIAPLRLAMHALMASILAENEVHPAASLSRAVLSRSSAHLPSLIPSVQRVSLRAMHPIRQPQPLQCLVLMSTPALQMLLAAARATGSCHSPDRRLVLRGCPQLTIHGVRVCFYLLFESMYVLTLLQVTGMRIVSGRSLMDVEQLFEADPCTLHSALGR